MLHLKAPAFMSTSYSSTRSSSLPYLEITGMIGFVSQRQKFTLTCGNVSSFLIVFVCVLLVCLFSDSDKEFL